MNLPSSPLPSSFTTTDAERGKKSIRALGWLLVVLGVLLSGATAVISLKIGNIIAHNDLPGAPIHWTGKPEFTATVFKLFGALFLFGLNAMLAGIYQVGTNRRSPVLIGIMALLLGVMIYFGYNVITTRHPSSISTPPLSR